VVREALIYKKWHTLVLDTPLEKLLPESPTWVVSRGKNFKVWLDRLYFINVPECSGKVWLARL